VIALRRPDPPTPAAESILLTEDRDFARFPGIAVRTLADFDGSM